MPEMNPFNFVNLYPLANDARRSPLSHNQFYDKANGEEVYSGQIDCVLTNFSPLAVLSYDQPAGDLIPARNGHKFFTRCFHYPDDDRPVIPATSLKGVARATAEAASNSCLSILSEDTTKIWADSRATNLQNLRFCGHNRTPNVLTPNGNIQFCPTCRIFGTAPEGEDSGTAERGAYPRAFQAKVRFSDAIFQGDLQEIYLPPQTLIALLGPKAPTTIRYEDRRQNLTKDMIPGRKFYYHHDDLRAWISEDGRKKVNSTVTPLKPGATFTFQVNFRNLLESELSLLLYALELEPAQPLVLVKGDQVTFDWQRLHEYNGVYPKLGYGKAAGLGSVCVLVNQLQLLNPAVRYSGKGRTGMRKSQGKELRDQVEHLKQSFLRAQKRNINGQLYDQPYLADLRQILRFPNGISSFHYFPRLQQAGPKILRLPFPGQEADWIG